MDLCKIDRCPSSLNRRLRRTFLSDSRIEVSLAHCVDICKGTDPTEITDSFVTRFVVEGDELAFAPDFQATINARYEWNLASGKIGHVMLNGSYSDEVNTDIVAENAARLLVSNSLAW